MSRFPDIESHPAFAALGSEQRRWLLAESARRNLHPLTLAQSLGWPVSVAPSQNPEDLKAGQELGRFVIVAKLGSGGMGVVYEARSRDPGDQRRYALKLLTSKSPEALARFEREALTMARLSPHRNVVRIDSLERVTEPFTGANANPMIVMEFVSGGSLEDRLKESSIGIDEVLEISAQIADALAHLHAAGVVHRDLKPANVLLRDGHEPALTDFGVARANDLANLTKTQEVVGTPHYMAPEQLDQGSRGAGPTTDIWALGVMLYEMATRRRPFEGESLTTLAAQIVAAEPPDPRTLDPKLPRGLSQILARALAKGPAERYSSAAHFAQDLRALRRGEALSHSRPSWFRKPLQRLRGPGAALTLASLTLASIAGLAVLLLLWQRQLSPEQLRQASALRDKALKARLGQDDRLALALDALARALPRTLAIEQGLERLSLERDASDRATEQRLFTELRDFVLASRRDGRQARVRRHVAAEDEWQSWLRALEFRQGIAGELSLPLKDDWSAFCRCLAALRQSDLEQAAAAIAEASPGSAEARAASSFARLVLDLLRGDTAAARSDWSEPDLRSIALQQPSLVDELQAALLIADCFASERAGSALEAELCRWNESEARGPRFEQLKRRIQTVLGRAKTSEDQDRALRAFERIRRLAWHQDIPRMELEPAEHQQLAERARLHGDRGAALYHIIQAHRRGVEGDLPEWARSEKLEGEFVNAYSIPTGNPVTRAQEALTLLLDLARAGYVLANAHRHFLINLYQTGVVEAALKLEPKDYALRGWRSESIRQLHSDGELELRAGAQAQVLLSQAADDAQAVLSWAWASPALRARSQAGLARLLASLYGLERRQDCRALLAAACAGPIPRRDDVLIQVYELAIGQDSVPALRKILDEAEQARRERFTMSSRPDLRNQRPVGAPISLYSPSDFAEALAEIHQRRGELEASTGNAELAIECFVLALEQRSTPTSLRSFNQTVMSSGRIAQGEAALPRLKAIISPERAAKMLARWHGKALGSEDEDEPGLSPKVNPESPKPNRPEDEK